MRRRVIVMGLLVLIASICTTEYVFGRDRRSVISHREKRSVETVSSGFASAGGETLAFFDFEDGLPQGWETVDLTCEPHWHVTSTGAYDGHSYYCAIETPVGSGYQDLWEDFLETPEIEIPEGITTLTLSFVHKVDTESPEEQVWDGSAVFLSEDGGSFHILFPEGGYTVDTLRAFEYRGQSGTPGWTGLGDMWWTEIFHLDEYVESSRIKIRYTFVSDVCYNSFTDFFTGVWVDEIVLTGDGDTLFFDDGGDHEPGRMTFSNPCHGDFWTITDDNSAIHQKYGDPYYPPEGWTQGSFSMVCDDRPLINAALVSPIFTLPEEGYPRASFYNLVEVPDYDGNGDGLLEDFFDVELSTAESNFLVWSSLFYDYGRGDNDSTWKVYNWDRDHSLGLHAYCGQQVKVRWRLHTDGDDDGGGGCDWIPCNGRGLFVDNVLLFQQPKWEHVVRIIRIIVPFPNSVNYPTPVTTEIVNHGSHAAQLAPLLWVLLDEELNVVGDPPYSIFELPNLTVAAGETTQVAFEWTPVDTGNFYIMAINFYPTYDDIFTTPAPVHVYESWRVTLGYFDRFSTDTTFFEAQSNSGPVVRFTAVDISWEAIALTGISVRGVELSGPLEIYILGEGVNDSTFGEALIEPFGIWVDGPQDQIEIDVREYIDILYVEGDFWFHVRATEQTEGRFFARENALDGGRSWWYSEGEMRSISGSWEILAETRRPAWAWCEGGALGDVNGDGSVNVIDVVGVIQCIFDISLLATDMSRYCRADCNRDGSVDVLDALGIINCIFGTGSCPP